VPIALKTGNLNILEPPGPVSACKWIALTNSPLSYVPHSLPTFFLMSREYQVRGIDGAVLCYDMQVFEGTSGVDLQLFVSTLRTGDADLRF